MSFLQEFNEQEKVLRTLIENRRDLISKFPTGNFDNVIFTGMGSSYSAGLLGADYLSSFKMPCFCVEPDVLLHTWRSCIGPRTLVILISQSGSSPEMIELAQHLPQEQMLAVLNNPQSRLGRICRYVVEIHAGSEKTTATKTYINSIATVYLVAEQIAGRQQSIWEGADFLFMAMDTLITEEEKVYKRLGGMFAHSSPLLLIGSGTTHSTAIQADYVIGEMGKVFTKSLTAGEFRHGPIESVSPEYVTILFDGDEDFYEDITALAEFLSRQGIPCLWLTNRSDISITPKGIHVESFPFCNKYLFPFVATIYAEIIGYHLCLNRNEQPGVLQYVRK